MSDFPLDDIITYWQVTYVNGQATYPGNGVAIDAAIASRSEEIITDKGKENVTSKLAVYFDSSDVDLKKDDFVKVGDFTGELFDASQPSPERILAVSFVPSGTTTKRLLI